ncbi:hypothetical protein SDC9_115309 [bioreactor metagenome]|uniref:Uncharacterized protein n=1 Tax=bioreactor metagenome TaxID=1076179 RepID=A0A645BT30_9ZZZZ
MTRRRVERIRCPIDDAHHRRMSCVEAMAAEHQRSGLGKTHTFESATIATAGAADRMRISRNRMHPQPAIASESALCRLTALITAFKDAVVMSGSIPTPQCTSMSPFSISHST